MILTFVSVATYEINQLRLAKLCEMEVNLVPEYLPLSLKKLHCLYFELERTHTKACRSGLITMYGGFQYLLSVRPYES